MTDRNPRVVAVEQLREAKTQINQVIAYFTNGAGRRTFDRPEISYADSGMIDPKAEARADAIAAVGEPPAFGPGRSDEELLNAVGNSLNEAPRTLLENRP